MPPRKQQTHIKEDGGTENSLQDIMRELKRMEKRNEDLREATKEDINVLKNEILNEIKLLRKENEELRIETMKEITSMKTEIVKIRKEQQSEKKEMEKNIDQLERKHDDRSRGIEYRLQMIEEKEERRTKLEKRNNIIIKSKEFNSKDREQIKEAADEILRSVDFQENIHEIQFIGEDKMGRGIVRVQMPNFTSKINTLKNKNKLKGKDTYIESDLTKQEREIQAAIRRTAQQEREKGKTVRVGYQKIQIDGIWENWNKLKTTEAKN